MINGIKLDSNQMLKLIKNGKFTLEYFEEFKTIVTKNSENARDTLLLISANKTNIYRNANSFLTDWEKDVLLTCDSIKARIDASNFYNTCIINFVVLKEESSYEIIFYKEKQISKLGKGVQKIWKGSYLSEFIDFIYTKELSMAFINDVEYQELYAITKECILKIKKRLFCKYENNYGNKVYKEVKAYISLNLCANFFKSSPLMEDKRIYNRLKLLSWIKPEQLGVDKRIVGESFWIDSINSIV